MRQRSKELRRRISAMDYLASGTLHSRTKVCGRKNCRCADEPEARHGPYHEWSRRLDGRLVHRIVSSDQAVLLAEAIANHREVRRLLALWEHETAEEILARTDAEKG